MNCLIYTILRKIFELKNYFKILFCYVNIRIFTFQLPPMNYIAIDIETNGLYPIYRQSKIFCCAVNTGKTVVVHIDINKLKPILEDPSICKVIHNASLDCFWLKMVHGISITNIWDTRLMEQVIIGETLPHSNKIEELRKELSTSLLYTLSRYGLAELQNKSMGAKFAGRSTLKPLTSEEIEYAKNDVRYLLMLQAMQERRIVKLGLTRVANLENRLVEVVTDMRVRGIGFDRKVWLTIAKENSLKYNDLLKRLPPQVENWNSPIQVKKYFRSVGVPMNSLTEVEELLPHYPQLEKFAAMRSMFKAVTTYGESWLKDDIKINTVDWDNRVRTDFEQIINTGRFSSAHPNLQQIPRKGGFLSAFVPAKDHVFIMPDYESQEIGIAAAASKEERWIKAILRGDDIHSLTASIIFADEWTKGKEKNCAFPKKCECPVHNEKRQIAKIVNFTILYGGGGEEVSLNAKLSLRDSERLIIKFKKSVPKLTRWLRNNMDETVKTGLSYSADPYRRRRKVRFRQYTIGKNNPIQACGANMIKLAMISINREKFPLVLQIHDALIFEVHKSKVKAACKEIKGVMEKAADYCTGVPGLIKVDPIISSSLQKPKK